MRVRVIDLRVTGEAPVEVDDRGVLEIFAATEPVALIAQLAARGFVVTSSQRDGSWLVRAGKGVLPPLVDLTELEAPEPMHRVLSALSALAPGEVFLALLPHRPAPLLPLLDARGASWEVALRPDGKALLWLSR
jgi:uncharacterized protein (DUF2249 family)